VLEGGGGSLGGREGSREFVNESVRVEGVEEVDITGRSREDCRSYREGQTNLRVDEKRCRLTGEGKFALSNVGLSRLLVRVGTVTKGELLGAFGQVGLLVGRCSRDGISRDVLTTEVV